VSTAAALAAWLVDRLWARDWRACVGPLAAVGVTGGLVSLPLGLDDGRGGEQLRKAVWLVEQGQYEVARRYVDSVAPEHARPGVLNFRVGEALVAAGQPGEAVARLQAALAIDGDRPAIHLALGRALGAAGKPAEALPHLSRAFEAGFAPESSGPALVWALAQSGRGADALAVLRRMPADAVAAVDAETARDVGELALELEAPAEAERWLRVAVTGEPESARAQELLGVALILQGRSVDAVQPLEVACRLDARSGSAQLNLAVAYAQVGRKDEAVRRVRESLRLEPDEPRATALLRALTGSP
jgi:Flp pilus assembly protein TadD